MKKYYHLICVTKNIDGFSKMFTYLESASAYAAGVIKMSHLTGVEQIYVYYKPFSEWEYFKTIKIKPETL